MQLTTIRQLFTYHHAAQNRLWPCLDHLTDAQFVQEVAYSNGSIRNHMVHLMSVEQRWFARVLGKPLPERLDYAAYPTRASVRTAWDAIQARIESYLADELTDEDMMRPVRYIMRRPHGDEEHTNAVWEILVHVVNHGTNHRAQLLRILHDFGAPTFEQDMMIFWWGE